jgi:hypothetical protein
MSFPASRAESRSGMTSSPPPLWRVNVRVLGYIPPDEGHVYQEVGSPLGIESICFVDNDIIAVSFVTREAPATLPRRNQVGDSLPFRLHAIFIDTKTGQVRAAREWPTASVRSRVLAVLGGKFAVLTPDQLMLYSADLDLLNTLDTPVGRESVKDDWQATTSPGDRYLLLSYEPATEEKRIAGLPPTVLEAQLDELEMRLEWIDLQNLRPVERWSTTAKSSEGFSEPEAISDEGLVQRVKRGKGNDGAPLYSYVVEIGKPPNGPWSLMCFPSDSFCGPGEFVNNDTILRTRLTGLDKDVQVWIGLLSTNGKLLFQQTFSKGEVPDQLRPGTEAPQRGVEISAGGRRFALAVAKLKGGNTFLDIGGHTSVDRIMVYDLPNRQWIYTLDAKTQNIKSISGMALSQDGSLLGLINQEGILEIFRVPARANPRIIQ